MTIAAAQHAPPRRPSDLIPLDSPGFTNSAVAEDSLSTSPASSSSTTCPSSPSSSDTSRVIAIHPTLVAPVAPKRRHQLLKKQRELAKHDPVATEGSHAGGDEGGVNDPSVGQAIAHQPSETDFGYRRTWGMRVKDKWRKVKTREPSAEGRRKHRKNVRPTKHRRVWMSRLMLVLVAELRRRKRLNSSSRASSSATHSPFPYLLLTTCFTASTCYDTSKQPHTRTLRASQLQCPIYPTGVSSKHGF